MEKYQLDQMNKEEHAHRAAFELEAAKAGVKNFSRVESAAAPYCCPTVHWLWRGWNMLKASPRFRDMEHALAKNRAEALKPYYENRPPDSAPLGFMRGIIEAVGGPSALDDLRIPAGFLQPGETLTLDGPPPVQDYAVEDPETGLGRITPEQAAQVRDTLAAGISGQAQARQQGPPERTKPPLGVMPDYIWSENWDRLGRILFRVGEETTNISVPLLLGRARMMIEEEDRAKANRPIPETPATQPEEPGWITNRKPALGEGTKCNQKGGWELCVLVRLPNGTVAVKPCLEVGAGTAWSRIPAGHPVHPEVEQMEAFLAAQGRAPLAGFENQLLDGSGEFLSEYQKTLYAGWRLAKGLPQ